MGVLFRNKAFLIVTGSDLLQNMAIWVRNMAILYFIMEQSQGDPVAVALITVLEYLPIFVFSFIGGAFADRWNPKRTMILGDVLSVLSIVLILFVLSSGYWQVLYAATFVSSIVSQFSQPSSAKIFKRNVDEEHVQTAIALTQSLHSLFIIVGPMLGTFIYTALGIEASLYSLLLLFGISGILLTFLPSMKKEKADTVTTIFADLKEGWQYVLRFRSLVMLALVFGIIGLAEGLVSPLQIFIVTDRLQLEETALQYMSGVAGMGLLIGGGLAAVLSNKLNQNITLIAAICIMAVTTMIEVLSTSLVLTLTSSFLGSVSMAFINVIISTYMVARIDESMIGRVNGTIMPLFMGMILAGSSLSGVLMSTGSMLLVYTLSTFIILLSIIPGLRIQFKEMQTGHNGLDSKEIPGPSS